MDGTVKIFEISTGKELHTFEIGDGGSIPSVEFNASGTHLVASGSTSFVAFKISTGERTVIDPGIGWIQKYRFSPDGRFMAAKSGTGIVIWDARTWKELRRFGGDLVAGKRGYVVFTRDSRHVAAVDNSGKLHFWDATTGADVHSVGEGFQREGPIEFTLDGRVMVAGTDDTIRVFGPGVAAPLKQPQDRK